MEEEFVVHGYYTVSNAGGYEIMLSDCGTMARVRDAFNGDTLPVVTDWLPIENEPIDGLPGDYDLVIDPFGYNIPLSHVMRVNN